MPSALFVYISQIALVPAYSRFIYHQPELKQTKNLRTFNENPQKSNNQEMKPQRHTLQKEVKIYFHVLIMPQRICIVCKARIISKLCIKNEAACLF